MSNLGFFFSRWPVYDYNGADLSFVGHGEGGQGHANMLFFVILFVILVASYNIYIYMIGTKILRVCCQS